MYEEKYINISDWDKVGLNIKETSLNPHSRIFFSLNSSLYFTNKLQMKS